jgi:phage terminase small subunit
MASAGAAPGEGLKELKKHKGGPRPGAGMPLGYRTKKTEAKRAAEAQVLAEAGVTAALVMDELRRVGFATMRHYFDAAGTVRQPADLSDDAAAALASFEVVTKNVTAGDGQQDTVYRFRLCDKIKALELMGKHFGLFVEAVELQQATAEARVARLLAARKRVGDDPEEA